MTKGPSVGGREKAIVSDLFRLVHHEWVKNLVHVGKTEESFAEAVRDMLSFRARSLSEVRNDGAVKVVDATGAGMYRGLPVRNKTKSRQDFGFCELMEIAQANKAAITHELVRCGHSRHVRNVAEKTFATQ